MGTPWTRYNSMTERYEFLHLQVSRRDEIERSWCLFQKSAEKEVSRPVQAEPSAGEVGESGEAVDEQDSSKKPEER
eukprot:3270279-Alexandrium_andersonii.AAC.1